MTDMMHWGPDTDIVPFRADDSLSWRLEALRRDVAQTADLLERWEAGELTEDTPPVSRSGYGVAGQRTEEPDPVANLSALAREVYRSAASDPDSVPVTPDTAGGHGVFIGPGPDTGALTSWRNEWTDDWYDALLYGYTEAEARTAGLRPSWEWRTDTVNVRTGDPGQPWRTTADSRTDTDSGHDVRGGHM